MKLEKKCVSVIISEENMLKVRLMALTDIRKYISEEMIGVLPADVKKMLENFKQIIPGLICYGAVVEFIPIDKPEITGCENLIQLKQKISALKKAWRGIVFIESKRQGNYLRLHFKAV